MNDIEVYFPTYPWPVNFIILGVILIFRYLILSGIFYSLCKWKQVIPIDIDTNSDKQIKRDIIYSVKSSLVFAAIGTFLVFIYQKNITNIYMDIFKYPLWYLPVSLLFYMSIHDTYFYWSHRLLHVFKFNHCHYVHHESKIPTAWTSFAFHPFEAFIQAIILPLLVLVIPIHWSMFILFLTLMSLFGILNHLGHELYPSYLEKYLGLINATHHQWHHRRVNQNFGLYFNWWDRLMNTERCHK